MKCERFSRKLVIALLAVALCSQIAYCVRLNDSIKHIKSLGTMLYQMNLKYKSSLHNQTRKTKRNFGIKF